MTFAPHGGRVVELVGRWKDGHTLEKDGNMKIWNETDKTTPIYEYQGPWANGQPSGAKGQCKYVRADTEGQPVTMVYTGAFVGGVHASVWRQVAATGVWRHV
jgi:hypothetical protein